MGLHRQIELLRPEMQIKVNLLLKELAERKITYFISETYREPQVQLVYHAQGRKPLEEVNALRKAAGLFPLANEKANTIITHAKVSKHSSGKAIDIIGLDQAGNPTWNKPDAWWQMVADLSKGLGLIPGYYWSDFKDAPHHELP